MISELVQFAQRTYQPNPAFEPRLLPINPQSQQLKEKHQPSAQAIAIMQFKLEQTVIKRNPDFKMDHRLTLSHVDFEQQTIHLNGHDPTW